MVITAKITSKGQVTIPKPIRDYLNAQIIEFEFENGKIIVRPVRKVAGSLKKYANPESIPKEKNAWEKAIRNKHENS